MDTLLPTQSSVSADQPADLPADLPAKDRRGSSPLRNSRLNTSLLRTHNARSLVEDVVEQVTSKITSGELVSGTKLPTEQLMMQTFGVSRTVVREAISRLQAAELVETRHGIGTFVLGIRERASESPAAPSLITMYDVLDMLEFRICLETQAAGLAALKRTEEDMAVLGEILQDFSSQVYTGGSAIAADMEFHIRISKSTGNKYFGDFYRFIGQNTIPRMRLTIAQYTQDSDEVYLMRLHLEHQAVYDAIARQDSESAQAAMRMHLVNSRERLRKALELESLQKKIESTEVV